MWLALLTAPYVGGGIVEIIRGLTDAMGSPFAITVFAVSYTHLDVYKRQDQISDEQDTSIPADPNVRNFSFALVDGKGYFR